MKEKIKILFLKLLNKVIPARVLYIKSKCLLKGCNQDILIMAIIQKLHFTDTEILDMIVKTHGKHLYAAHKVKSFIGLEFKTLDMKYSVMGGYAHPEKIKEGEKC